MVGGSGRRGTQVLFCLIDEAVGMHTDAYCSLFGAMVELGSPIQKERGRMFSGGGRSMCPLCSAHTSMQMGKNPSYIK